MLYNFTFIPDESESNANYTVENNTNETFESFNTTSIRSTEIRKNKDWIEYLILIWVIAYVCQIIREVNY